MNALGAAGHEALTMPGCLALLARGVPDATGIPWTTSSSREFRGHADDGSPLVTLLHRVPASYPSELSIDLDGGDFAAAAAGRLGPSITLPADSPAHVLALARLGGSEAEAHLTMLSERTGRRVRLACADEADAETGRTSLVGYAVEEDGGSIVIRTRTWKAGLASRFVLSRIDAQPGRIRAFHVDPLVAAASAVVMSDADDIEDGADDTLHLLRPFAGRVGVVHPKDGHAVDRTDILHEAAIVQTVPGLVRIEVHHDGSPFLRYALEDVAERAPPGCNAYWCTGQVALEGDRVGFDVIFCRASVERRRRYRSQGEVENDPGLAVAVADALAR